MKADFSPVIKSEAHGTWQNRYFGPEIGTRLGKMMLLLLLLNDGTRPIDQAPEVLAYEYCVTNGSQEVEVQPGDTPLGLTIEYIAGWEAASQAEITEQVNAMPGNFEDGKNFTASNLHAGSIELPKTIQCETTAVNIDGLLEITHPGKPIIETNQ